METEPGVVEVVIRSRAQYRRRICKVIVNHVFALEFEHLLKAVLSLNQSRCVQDSIAVSTSSGFKQFIFDASMSCIAEAHHHSLIFGSFAPNCDEISKSCIATILGTVMATHLVPNQTKFSFCNDDND